MEVFRTKSEIHACPYEKHTGNNWLEMTETIKIPGGLILTGLTDVEHDSILNIMDNLDPLGLRGFKVTMIIENSDDNDPKQLGLLSIPVKDQIIRHQDRYYEVKRVLQSSSFTIAVFASRISFTYK